jgi:hypothetical protein
MPGKRTASSGRLAARQPREGGRDRAAIRSPGPTPAYYYYDYYYYYYAFALRQPPDIREKH